MPKANEVHEGGIALGAPAETNREVLIYSYYRDAELRGANLLFRLLRIVDDPESQIMLSEHLADETRHAWLWTQRIQELGATPVPVDDGYQVRIGKRAGLPRNVVDLLSLTALLYFAGGPTNPFTIFYFVNLALSAVILPARWSWALTGVAIVCLAFLFVDHVELPELERPPGSQRSIAHERLTLGQQGLLVALAAGAIVLIYFITRVTRELSQRENQLRIAEQQRARSEKLEALGTLAAGAGHELATPLSTIAVVAKELTHHLEGVDVPQTVKEDVTLIRSEVDLCRSILDRMKGNVGQAIAEQTKAITIERLIEEVMDGLHQCERVQIDVADGIAERPISLPVQSVAQAIRGVLQNALDASSPNDTVQFTVLRTDGAFRLEVQDRGVGMSEEVLARAGEPFFTTKEPGKGMGLGLFLTRSVVERLGGTLRLYSNREQGVTAVIELPDESASTQPAW